MKKTVFAVLLGAMLVATVGCSHKEQTSSGNESTSTESTAAASTAAPNTANAGYVKFDFNDVAVTTSGAPVLRLGFVVHNNGSDPLLCEESSFTLQLSDGSTLNPDAGAENTCDPDTIDASSTGKAVMFFDLKGSYSGPVTLIMRDNSNAIIGEGTTQVQS